jgi:mycoredoxin
MTTAVRRHLEDWHVPYRYVDIDEDRAAAKWVSDRNNGKEKKPTIDVAGEILTEPSPAELERLLRGKQLLT